MGLEWDLMRFIWISLDFDVLLMKLNGISCDVCGILDFKNAPLVAG